MFLIFLMLQVAFSTETKWHVIGDQSKSLTINPTELFVKSNKGWARGIIKSDPQTLGRQAHHALRYVDEMSNVDKVGVQSGLFSALGPGMPDVEGALAIVAHTAMVQPVLLSSPSWWEMRILITIGGYRIP